MEIKKLLLQPVSMKTPSGGKMMAAMILIISEQVKGIVCVCVCVVVESGMFVKQKTVYKKRSGNFNDYL